MRAAIAGASAAVLVLVAGLIVISDGGETGTPASATPSSRVSASASATGPPAKIRPPTRLRLDRGLTSTGLAWTAPDRGAPVDHYEVFRDGKRLVRTTRSSYTDQGLTIGTHYRYWVVSVDADGRASHRLFRDVTTQVPPPSQALLDGTFTVTAQLGSHDGTRVRFTSQTVTWTFTSQCPTTACSAAWRATHSGAGGSVITSGVARRVGGEYHGTWRGPFLSRCRDRHLDAVSDLTIVLRVTAGHVVDGRWLAAGVSGSIQESVDGCGGVPRATYTF